MSSNSMDEDEPTFPMLLDKNNDDYKEACDHEVNHMIPRLERLHIHDEPLNLLSGNEQIPSFPVDTNSSVIDSDEENSRDDSSKSDCLAFINNISDNICSSEDTKVTIGNENSQARTEETMSNIPFKNTQIDVQPQDVVQKILNRENSLQPIDQNKEQKSDAPKETKENTLKIVNEENPLDFCLRHELNPNETYSGSSIAENKTELLSLMEISRKTRHLDAETGEASEISNIIPPENSNSNRIGDPLEQYAGEMASDIIFDLDSSIQSNFGNVSSGDTSLNSSGIIIDSPSVNVTTAASIENKCTTKTEEFISPTSWVNLIRQRRFGIFQQPSINTQAPETLQANYSSDEDFKKSSTIEKDSPVYSKRIYRRTLKSSPKPKTLDLIDVESNDEKRPSPSKRKNSPTENSTETTGKLHKRSVSEQNSETTKKAQKAIRSRSLSAGLKNTLCTSPTYLLNEVSIIPQSRKRTNPDSQNIGRVKSRRSSNSSDDA